MVKRKKVEATKPAYRAVNVVLRGQLEVLDDMALRLCEEGAKPDRSAVLRSLIKEEAARWKALQARTVGNGMQYRSNAQDSGPALRLSDEVNLGDAWFSIMRNREQIDLARSECHEVGTKLIAFGDSES